MYALPHVCFPATKARWAEALKVAMQTLASSPVRDDIADAFITASRALVGIAVRSINVAPVEVTLVQHRLLVLLATGGDQTVGALAEQLEINASNASRLCDRLQKLGFIARDRSSSDGRAVDVSLTAAGHDLLETVRTYRRREIQRVLGHMPRTDVDTTIKALTAFGEAAHEVGEAAWTVHVF
jgi:DNA-binding MarR family transcriptional regulator